MSLRYQRYWLALGFLWVAIVIFLSLMPNPPQAMSFEQSDKVSHLLAYACLMLWFCQLYGGVARRWGLALAFVALGVGLEYLQDLTPYRTFDVLDMAANTGGVLFGWVLAATPLGRGLQLLEVHGLGRCA